MYWLVLLLIVTPLVELALLLVLSHYTSIGFTLGLVIVTGVCGAWLARREGVRAARRVQSELRAGRMPSEPLLDGLMIFVAGALLVTPGVLTDVVGFSLLLPAGRRWWRAWLQRRWRGLFRDSTVHFEQRGYYRDASGEVIDSYVIETAGEDEPPAGKRPEGGAPGDERQITQDE